MVLFSLQDIKKMLERIRKFQILNNQIFAILKKYKSAIADDEPSVLHIEPPTPSTDEESPREGTRQEAGDQPESDVTKPETDRTSAMDNMADDNRQSQFSMFSLDDEEFAIDEPVQTEA